MVRVSVIFFFVLSCLVLPPSAFAVTPDDSPLLYSAQSWVRVGEYLNVEFQTFDAGHEQTDEYAAAVHDWLREQWD